MKLALFFLASLPIFAQNKMTIGLTLQGYTAAQLGSYAPAANTFAVQTDSLSTSCAGAITGGGSTRCIVLYGAAWAYAGGASTAYTAGPSGAIDNALLVSGVIDVDTAYIPGLTLNNPFTGSNTFGAIGTATNCASSGGTCSTASAGASSIAAAATTVTVATTRVTANSQIILTFDSSLGARLGITCNTTFQQPYVVTRTAATSFVVNVASGPVTNGLCFNWAIFN